MHEERSAGWGCPGRGTWKVSNIKNVALQNLNTEAGIDIFKISDDSFTTDIEFSTEPWYAYESMRDINNEEYLSVGHHEIVLFFIVKLPSSKDKVSFSINGNLIDCVWWLTRDELKQIIYRENSDDWVTTLAHRNKKSLCRERVLFSQLEPFYPNKISGEGMIRDDYHALKYLIDNWSTVSELSKLETS